MSNKYIIKHRYLLIIGLAISGNSFAESTDFDLGLSPLGLTTGYTHSGFNISPSLRVGNGYNTNIYMSDKNQGTIGNNARANLGVKDSYFAQFQPGIKINSDWNRHSLNLLVNSSFTRYATQPKNNNTNNMTAQLNGRLDILHNSFLDGTMGYTMGTVARYSADQTNSATPSNYVNKSFQTNYNHMFNWLTLKTGISAIRTDFDNTQSSTNTTLQMNTQNNWMYSSNLRLGHFFKREYEAFVNVIYSKNVYDTTVCTNGNCGNTSNPITGNPVNGSVYNSVFNRNSSSYNFLTGMAFDITGLIKGDISMGYLQGSYEDPRLPAISGMNGFGDLRWSVTQLTTVTANLARIISPTTQAGVSGILQTTVGLNVTHELKRDIILNLSVNYNNYLYEGYIAPYTENRNDNMSMVSFRSRYLINKNISTDLSYSYQMRDSNYQGSSYEASIIMLNLNGQY
jgi:hypothetical protein